MDYYQMIKETKTVQIRSLASNPDEVINTLDEIEKEHGIELTLPYYDDIFGLLAAGIVLNKDSILKYYGIYLKTFYFSSCRLNNAIRAFEYSTLNSIKELYQFLPWYKKLWGRFSDWLRKRKYIK
jgi:hypothetical protein